MTPELFAFPTLERAERFLREAIALYGQSLEWMACQEDGEYLVAVRTRPTL